MASCKVSAAATRREERGAEGSSSPAGPRLTGPCCCRCRVELGTRCSLEGASNSEARAAVPLPSTSPGDERVFGSLGHVAVSAPERAACAAAGIGWACGSPMGGSCAGVGGGDGAGGGCRHRRDRWHGRRCGGLPGEAAQRRGRAVSCCRREAEWADSDSKPLRGSAASVSSS